MPMKMRRNNSGKTQMDRKKLSKQSKRALITVVLSFILVFTLVIISNQFTIIFPGMGLQGFEAGEIAKRDLIADQNYTYTDRVKTEKLINDKLSVTPPVFEFKTDIMSSVMVRFKDFSEKLLSYRESEKDETRVVFKNSLMEYFDFDELNIILDNADPYVVIPIASDLLEDILNRGIVQISDKISFENNRKIEIWKWEKGRKHFYFKNTDEIIMLDNLEGYIDKKLSLKGVDSALINPVHLIIDEFVRENIIYDEIETTIKYDAIVNDTPPVTENITAGDIVIKSGSKISAVEMEKAEILNANSNKLKFSGIISVFVLLSIIYLFSYLMFRPLFVNKRRKYQYIYLLTSFYLFFILFISLINQFDLLGNYILSLFLPTALLGMMIVVLIGFQEGIISIAILSMSLYLFSDVTISGFIFSFVTGISSVFLIKDVEKRIDLLKASSLLAVINIFLLLFALPHNFELKYLFISVVWGALNALLSGVVTLTLIPVFEHFLNIPTVFRLMELSDMNAPLFRKMVTMAPGTYGHSVAVASLADAACRDIGANPLLARVGAYYHDIGKLDQAEYFIENQTEANKHDMLNPSLSVAVIKSHVKVGVEKAKEMGLPFEIIEIIAQHHGSGLIGFFYIEAINKKGAESKVLPEDYSYTGIPPESKEAAVVMLADTVEAASRVLKKPTITKLDKFIWKLIMEKIERGQMVNSALTMNDMLIIKKSFLQILSGYFHTRIEYPKIKKKAV